MSQRINNRTVIPLVVGILVIAGIGLTAGALPHAANLNTSGDIHIPENDPGMGPPRGNPGQNNFSEPGNATMGGDQGGFEGITTCIEWLASTGGTLLVVLGFLGIVGLIYQRFSFSAAVLTGWTIMPPIALVYFMLTNCAGGGTDTGAGLPALPGTNIALETAPSVPPWAVVGIVGVVFVAAVGLMYRTMSEQETVTLEEEEMEAEPELDAFAEAAGRAADRIERHDVDVDNAVYEAWVEMTRLLEVDNPDVYSPGEFADTAIDLGMNEDDVMELTELFNEVRYGDKEAATREDRAVDVLRNIEEEYGTETSESRGEER